MAYSIHKCTGSGATLDNFRFRPTFWFELRHDDGKVASQTAHYFVDGLTSRQVNGYRLQMAKLLPRYEAYLAKHGVRWEVMREEQRAAEKKAKDRKNRIAWLEKHIPLYKAELLELLNEKEVPA
jgi:hypothetical protein